MILKHKEQLQEFLKELDDFLPRRGKDTVDILDYKKR
jgi:hypothetical protein